MEKAKINKIEAGIVPFKKLPCTGSTSRALIKVYVRTVNNVNVFKPGRNFGQKIFLSGRKGSGLFLMITVLERCSRMHSRIHL